MCYVPNETAIDKKESSKTEYNQNLNKDCAAFVGKNLRAAFAQQRIPQLAKEVVVRYGVERSLYVLGKTIQCYKWDIHYSNKVIARASKCNYSSPDKMNPCDKDCSKDYLVYGNSAALNILYEQLIGLEENRPVEIYFASYETAEKEGQLQEWKDSFRSGRTVSS